MPWGAGRPSRHTVHPSMPGRGRNDRPIGRLGMAAIITAAGLAWPGAAMAQTRSGWDSTVDILAWLTGIIVVAAILAVIGMKIYRSYKREDSGAAPAFTLADLRRMHREGQLSDAEFEQAKAAIIGATVGQGGGEQTGGQEPDTRSHRPTAETGGPGLDQGPAERREEASGGPVEEGPGGAPEEGQDEGSSDREKRGDTDEENRG